MKLNYLNRISIIVILVYVLCSECMAGGKNLIVSFMEMKGKGPGWGLAIVIQTPEGHTYLFDTGSNYPNAGFDAGKDMIAPFLKKNNIKQIDGILISHSHNDHFGGFQYLMNNYTVKQLYDSGYTFSMDSLYDTLYKPEYCARGGVYNVIKQGDTLKWDKNLSIVVLSPPSNYLKESISNYTDPIGHHNPNLNSVVLRLKYKNIVFLLVGDLISTGQEYLMKQYEAKELKTTVFCLGHGGSFLPFAEVIKPEIVISSCLNGVEQPANEAKKIYSQVGSKVYATCWNGIVQVVSDGNTYSVLTERN